MKITAESERLAAVMDHARLGLFTGALDDQEAIERALELGLVEQRWQGVAGFIGLSNLFLTEPTRTAMDGVQP